MRAAWFVLAALALASCQSSAPTASNTPTPEPAPNPTPVAPAPKPAAVTPEPDKPVEEPQKKDPSHNPSRIYQLKELETTVVTIGKNKLTAWVMDTDSKRTEGMMFLQKNELKADSAMLFVFPDELDRSFWMRNTYVPLDIAYIAANGRIVSAKAMKALDETGVPSDGPAMYVLEMQQGAFKRLGIKAGMKAIIDPKVKSK